MYLMTLVRAAIAVSFAVILSTGCGNGAPSGGFPDWLPARVADVSIRPTDASGFAVAEEHAISIASKKFFIEDRSPPTPEAFAALITGPVFPDRPIVVGPSGELPRRPFVRNKRAWLIVWRGLQNDLFEDPDNPTNNFFLVDLVVVIDATNGGVLANRVLSGPNRLAP
jgi:hypothetical protein